MAANQIYLLDDDVVELRNNVEPPVKKGDSPKRPMVVNNSSSDEDEKREPVVKKKRATRRPRKRAEKAEKENDENFNIYGSAVTECYKKIETGLHKKVDDRVSSDEEDVNNNDPNNNNNRPAEASETKRKSPRKPKQRPVEHTFVSPPSQPSPRDGSTPRERSPSPPPTPGIADYQAPYGRRKRGPRRPKAVKEALAEIQAMKRTMPYRDFYHNASLHLGDVSLDSSLEEGRGDEITVKIRTLRGIDRFTMKQHETFLSVFEQLAGREGVPVDRCLMFRDEDNIEPYMTPASARITVADIIGFCVRAEGEEEEEDDDGVSDGDPESITLQVQARGLKHKTKVSMLRSESLLKLMLEFSRQQSRDLNSLRFYFDGELVERHVTPRDLDMDDLDCLDAVFL